MQIDCPVSGGVGGATKGTLAVMVSGPRAEIDQVKDALAVFGKVFVIGEKPGMAQTMKLANNFLSATAMAPPRKRSRWASRPASIRAVMIDVINAGVRRSTASDGKFPQAILPRTFNYGFGTALMLEDVRLCSEEAKSFGTPYDVMNAVLRQWGKPPISRSRRRADRSHEVLGREPRPVSYVNSFGMGDPDIVPKVLRRLER